MERRLYTGLEELVDPAAAVAGGFGSSVGGSLIADDRTASSRLTLEEGCGFVGSLVVGFVAVGVVGRMARSYLPLLVET